MKIRIEAAKQVSGTRVWIDDVEIHKIRNVEFGHPAGDIPTVTLLLIPDKIEISGEVAEVHTLHSTICPQCNAMNEAARERYENFRDLIARVFPGMSSKACTKCGDSPCRCKEIAGISA